MITIKQILLSNKNWWHFYNKHKTKIRPAIVENIIKLLSCRERIRGFATFKCSNSECSHIKFVNFTCKSRACSSCGKKATEAWIKKQNGILPDTTWQHITFTMPSVLWDFFWYNRHLFNSISALAAQTILTIAHKKGVSPAIFTAIHSFGRDLKRNVHIHLSTTRGGINKSLDQWKNLFFPQNTLMAMWRYNIITLFRTLYKNGTLVIPNTLVSTLNSPQAIKQFFDEQYRKTWIVHCSKPSNHYKHTVNYIGAYIKRPPIAQSKLSHYDGQEVVFKYLNHHDGQYYQFKCNAEVFIARFIQHIPDKYFKMIRYYGVLANRVRGELLPIVHQLLGHEKNIETKKIPITWANLIKREFNVNPLTCIICGSAMILTSITLGISTQLIMQYHRELALLKKIP